MAKKIDFRKLNRDYIYERNVLKALLVASTSEDNLRFPTIKEFILSEVVNGTIEYIGGNAGEVNYQSEGGAFEINLYKYFKSEIETHSKGKLNPKIREVLDSLCEYHLESPTGPDGSFLETKLYNHFKGRCGGYGICQLPTSSSFSLPQDLVIEVNRQILPSLSNEERRDILGIGKSMREYVDRDLEFMAQTSHW